MEPNPDFSIIIPVYNNWQQLRLCLDAVEQQTEKDDAFEIIVVDNASIQKMPEDFRVLKNMRIEYESEPGSYSARNRGAEFANGKYLAFTDSDCIPDKNWLSRAKDLYDNKDCDLIGGRIDLFKLEGGGKWAYIYESHTAFRQDEHVPRGKSVTANLFVKKRVFDSLGGFDSNVKSGGDWEFTERALSEGYTMIYGDDVAVKHPARKSVSQILKKQKRFAAWGYLNVKNRYGHSGLRIIGSQLLRGTPAAFKSAKYPKDRRNKLIVLLISLQNHIYKIFLQMLFLLKILNPEKIRE